MSSLNPVLTVGRQLTEAIHAHQSRDRARRRNRARGGSCSPAWACSEPERVMRTYPHTLSGGMRQRVMIAMALCCGPKPAHCRRAHHRAGRDHSGADHAAAYGAEK